MTSQCSNETITILNDFSSEKMISFKLNISRSELTLICGYYLKQVVKVNWKKNLVKINVHWRHWHYFIVYISYWKVYQVNYKEESFAWKYIEKFPATNKLTKLNVWPSSMSLFATLALSERFSSEGCRNYRYKTTVNLK